MTLHVRHAVGAVDASSLDEDGHWSVVQLKPAGLDRARLNLTRQGYAFFCPMERQPVRGSGAKKTRPLRVLFPGYAFVGGCSSPADWRRINATMGVSRLLLGSDQRPALLPRQFMSGLFQVTDDEGVLLPPRTLERGARVQILSGAFAKWIGRVEECRPNERYILLLELMGRQVRADVPLSELSRV